MLIHERYGCKVGWATYDNESEARARAVEESAKRDARAAQGYDFGYQWPGAVAHHPQTDERAESWTVTTV